MKKFSFYFIWIFVILFFYSCNKTESIIENLFEPVSSVSEGSVEGNDDGNGVDSVMWTYNFYFDGIQVNQNEFDSLVIPEYTNILDNPQSTALDRIIDVMSFSTKQNMLYALPDLEGQLNLIFDFEIAVSQIDTTASDYEFQVNNLHEKFFGSPPSRSIFTQMYDLCRTEGSDYTTMIRARWNLWVMNNRVSSLEVFGLAGAGLSLYDLTWFRRKMVHAWFVLGFTEMCLPSNIDNRTNSSTIIF